eukprot:3961076-Pyramimonas_sp.AAC.1
MEEEGGGMHFCGASWVSWELPGGLLEASWKSHRASLGHFVASLGPLWPSRGVPGTSDAVGGRLGCRSGPTLAL